MNRPVRYRVGRIVLDGFSPAERAGVVAAIEQALRGANVEEPARPRLESGPVAARPAEIGKAVAASLGKGGR